MSTRDGKCDDCGNGPFPATMPGLFFEVKGFEEQRVGGGANKIALRERTGGLLCAHCAGKRKRGVAPGQQGMKL